MQDRAADRAVGLLLDIAGGEPGPVTDHRAQALERPPITLRSSRIRRLLGKSIAAGEVADILVRLGMQVTAHGDDWQVVVPSFRYDVGIEADLIEEVARVHGYDRFSGAPSHMRPILRPMPEGRVDAGRVSDCLVAQGYHEAITYSFISPQLQAGFSPGLESIELANPISADMAVMRASLWPGLVSAVQYNLSRQRDRVRLFEAGLVFTRENSEILQKSMIAGAITGPLWPLQWHAGDRDVDFFDVRHDIEAVLALGGLEADFRPCEHPALHPGQSAGLFMEGRAFGYFGRLHPQLADIVGVRQDIYLFELELETLAGGRTPLFKTLSKFPQIRRDISLVVDSGVPAGRVLDIIRGIAPETMRNLELFDVYLGEGVDPEKKNLAISLTFQGSSSTLIDDEVDTAIQGILAELNNNIGATLRE